MVRVVAHLGRQVEGHAQPRHAVRQQMPVPLIRLAGRPEAGVLPHRPEPAPVHRRLDTPGERKFTRTAEVPVGIPVGWRGRNGWRINHITPYRNSIVLDSTESRSYNEPRPTFTVSRDRYSLHMTSPVDRHPVVLMV